MKTQLRRINSALVLTVLSLFVLAIYSCRQQEPSISEEPEMQVIPLDTALFTDLIQQKINALSGHTPFDVRGAKIYADRSLSRLYHLNNFLPLWSNGEMYKTFIKILEEIHFDGLLSRDYNLNLLKSLYHQIDTAQHLDHDILSDLGLVATNSFLLLTLHLVEGKSEPHLLDPNWNYNFFHIDPHGIDSVYHYLSRKKIEYLVNRIRARNELYADMRKTLIDLYRIKANGGWDSVVYEGKVKIEPGDSAATIPMIRKRLIATDTLLEVAPVQVYQYDSGLVSAVVRFQHQLSG